MLISVCSPRVQIQMLLLRKGAPQGWQGNNWMSRELVHIQQWGRWLVHIQQWGRGLVHIQQWRRGLVHIQWWGTWLAKTSTSKDHQVGLHDVKMISGTEVSQRETGKDSPLPQCCRVVWQAEPNCINPQVNWSVDYSFFSVYRCGNCTVWWHLKVLTEPTIEELELLDSLSNSESFLTCPFIFL